MHTLRKKIVYILLGIICWAFYYAHNIPVSFAAPPSFQTNFADYVLGKKWSSENKSESVWDLSALWIDPDQSLEENIRNIFYPDYMGQGGRLRDIVKYLGFVVFVIMIVRQGLQYVLHADDSEKISWFHVNFAYIFLWWLIFFGATWILWIGLSIGWAGWSSALMESFDRNVMFQVLSALRAWAFFIAIILLVYTGRHMMSAMDNEEKFKRGRQGILNILISLILIKLIDYIYYIAQTPDLGGRITTLIVEVSKVLGYLVGAFFIVMVMYYGFRLMFGGTQEELKKVKRTLIGVFLWWLVVFFFLLIIYQIAQEFI